MPVFKDCYVKLPMLFCQLTNVDMYKVEKVKYKTTDEHKHARVHEHKHKTYFQHVHQYTKTTKGKLHRSDEPAAMRC